jgi:hypothetical protein
MALVSTAISMTVRRVLELASGPVLVGVAWARARIHRHVRKLISRTPDGFPWIAVAGTTLTGWTVTDLDGTLITAYPDKENARPTWKMGYSRTSGHTGRAPMPARGT